MNPAALSVNDTPCEGECSPGIPTEFIKGFPASIPRPLSGGQKIDGSSADVGARWSLSLITVTIMVSLRESGVQPGSKLLDDLGLCTCPQVAFCAPLRHLGLDVIGQAYGDHLSAKSEEVRWTVCGQRAHARTYHDARVEQKQQVGTHLEEQKHVNEQKNSNGAHRYSVIGLEPPRAPAARASFQEQRPSRP